MFKMKTKRFILILSIAFTFIHSAIALVDDDVEFIKTFRRFLNTTEGVKLDNLDAQIRKMKSAVNIRTMIEVFDDLENLPGAVTLTTSLFNLRIQLDKVDNTYEVYLKKRKSNKSANNRSLYKFVDESRSSYVGPMNDLNTIYSMIVPKDVSTESAYYTDDLSILSHMKKHMEIWRRTCDTNKSPQQILQNLYMSLSAAELKVYSIMHFSYEKLAEIGECNFNEEMTAFAQILNRKIDKKISMFEQFMSQTSREVWMCDPKKHVEGETYTQLKNVFQKYVVNTEDMNSQTRCDKRCSDFKRANATNCVGKKEYFDSVTGYTQHSICGRQRKCSGQLHDCESRFFSYKHLWICPSEPYSHRRYDFMLQTNPQWERFSVQQSYGGIAKKADCPRHLSYDYQDFDENKSNHCETCLCTCSDTVSDESENRVNARAVFADDDYVITGVKLVKKDRTLHIQIEQGKIMPMGGIDAKTIHWKPIAEPQHDFDLRFLDWVSQRSVYLGVSKVPEGQVLVGLKLVQLKNGRNNMFAFQTASLVYDYPSGKLGDPLSLVRKVHNPDISASRQFSTEFEVNLDNCDVPTRTPMPSVPQPGDKKYVRFTTSDFDKDVGQSMIPFIDIQNVTVRPAVPLSGVGFYHKSREGYGGFLGVKLQTFDFSSYLFRN